MTGSLGTSFILAYLYGIRSNKKPRKQNGKQSAKSSLTNDSGTNNYCMLPYC